MTLDEIKTADKAQLETRKAEIRTLSDDPSADVDALITELDAIQERNKELDLQAEQRQKLHERVAKFGTVVGAGEPEVKPQTRSYDASSEEYRKAWLKDMATMRTKSGNVSLFGEMTTEEREAFTFVTSNSSAVVPTAIADRIIELVESQAPMYEDSTKSNLEQGFGVPRHKSIVNGDAKATDEGAANDDEEDEFDLLSLDGIEIKKHIKISRKMKFKSLKAFENWIVEHLSKRIAVAKDKIIRQRLDNPTYGIASENIISNQEYADSTILSIFGKLSGDGKKCIYANSETIWSYLANIRNLNGDKVFIPDSTKDPVEGRIYGAEIRVNNEIPTHTIYLGHPQNILSNDYDELTIGSDVNVTTWVETVSAYSLFDAGLEKPKAFVKATFIPATASKA